MNENRYFGMKDWRGGYDGLILQEFKDGGLSLFYMSTTGWVEQNDLIFDLHDTGTVPISAETARQIAAGRFSRPLDRGGAGEGESR